MFGKTNSFDRSGEMGDGEICLYSETLSFNDDGSPKFVVKMSESSIFLQKELYNKEIATFMAPKFKLKADMLSKKSEIGAQLDSLLEVTLALNQKNLEREDGEKILKDNNPIIALMDETVGFQGSLFFSSSGVRPSAGLRKLRKSANTGRFYFAREVVTFSLE